jgi:hypothetical protein
MHATVVLRKGLLDEGLVAGFMTGSGGGWMDLVYQTLPTCSSCCSKGGFRVVLPGAIGLMMRKRAITAGGRWEACMDPCSSIAMTAMGDLLRFILMALCIYESNVLVSFLAMMLLIQYHNSGLGSQTRGFKDNKPISP